MTSDEPAPGPSREPPGPPRRSLFGVAAEFQRDPLGLVSNALRDYGDLVSLPGPPGQRAYLLNDPAMIHAVLVTHAGSVEKPKALKALFRASFGNGLFFSEGAHWKTQRKLAQPAFHSSRIEGYAAAMVRRAEAMTAFWRDGEVRDLEKELSVMALGIVIDALFGTHFDEDLEGIDAAVGELGAVLGRQAAHPLLAALPDWAPHPLLARKRRASSRLDKALYRIIERRATEAVDRGDLLSMLLLARDEKGAHMSSRQLHDEVMTIFLAGHETTALALAWALVLLARHPEAEAKLQAEIDDVLGNRQPGYADLPHLPYTEMVVKETLRLYPPAWLLLRQARTTLDLGDFRAPQRSFLWICPYTMHRHPRYYENADAFSPERFDPEAGLEARLPKGAYLPFGAGPRTCIGNAFALLEARLALACVVRRHRLTEIEAGGIRPRAGATLGFERGAPMRVAVRPS